jgi:hypothetical protein
MTVGASKKPREYVKNVPMHTYSFRHGPSQNPSFQELEEIAYEPNDDIEVRGKSTKSFKK